LLETCAIAEKPTAIAKQIGGPSLDNVRDIHLPTEKGQTLVEQRLPLSLTAGYSSFAIGVNRTRISCGAWWATKMHAAFREESRTSLLLISAALQEIRESHVAFRGFLPRKTTPRDLYPAPVIAKLP
jgi:hypothetical protein